MTGWHIEGTNLVRRSDGGSHTIPYTNVEAAQVALNKWVAENGRCVECGDVIYTGYSESVVAKMRERQVCFTCNFWLDHIEAPNQLRYVRVDGKQYWIGDDDKTPSKWRGFGGARWDIEFFDGRRVITTNLWYNGVIPTHFRSRLPDNARFLNQ